MRLKIRKNPTFKIRASSQKYRCIAICPNVL